MAVPKIDMATECLLVDIDGFSGAAADAAAGPAAGNTLIPREIGIVQLRMAADAPPALVAVQSMYFTGGMTPEFRRANAGGLAYQSRSVHGFPTDDNSFRHAVPAGALAFRLPHDPVAAALEGETIAALRLSAIALGFDPTSRVVLMHKGGSEGRWLAPLAARMAAARRAPVDVVDLNDFSCPRVGALLRAHPRLPSAIEEWCGCGEGVHVHCRRRWARHCPQAECLVLAGWTAAVCRLDAHGQLTRRPTLDAEGLERLLAARPHHLPSAATWKAAAPGTSAYRRCQNFIRAALMRGKEYVTPAAIDEYIARKRGDA